MKLIQKQYTTQTNHIVYVITSRILFEKCRGVGLLFWFYFGCPLKTQLNYDLHKNIRWAKITNRDYIGMAWIPALFHNKDSTMIVTNFEQNSLHFATINNSMRELYFFTYNNYIEMRDSFHEMRTFDKYKEVSEIFPFRSEIKI